MFRAFFSVGFRVKKRIKKRKYPFPRALLSWFQSGGKGLGSCNRFEELNK